MRAFVKYISYYLPKRIVTNEELVKDFPEWTAEKVMSKVGVSERHITAENETATDMAICAAENLFAENNFDKSIIDFVLFCTQSSDYFLPSSACVLQNKLGLPTACGAFDFNLGCSGFVYGLAVAKGLVCSGIAHNVLLLTAETYTKYLHPQDKGNRTIFADGASATLISTSGFAEIGEFELGTDGAGAENLIVKTGAARQRMASNDLHFDKNNNPLSSDYLYMNGGEIFNFTADAVPILVAKVFEKNHMTDADVNLYVFHQANKYMINYLRKLLEIDKERFYVFMETVGNTVSSTIPIALCEAKKADLLHGNILLAGFGVGYSWGGVILKIEL